MKSNLLNTVDLFEDAKIWPIKLILPRKIGYTLWGTNFKGNDVFLSREGKIIFFKTLPSLFDFIGDRCLDTNLSVFSGHKKFNTFIIESDLPKNIEIDCFDFTLVQDIICKKKQLSSIIQCMDALDCLNFLYDVGMTLNEKNILSVMKRGHGELAGLMDTLTFIENHELHVLEQFDFCVICNLYTQFLKFFDKRSIIL